MTSNGSNVNADSGANADKGLNGEIPQAPEKQPVIFRKAAPEGGGNAAAGTPREDERRPAASPDFAGKAPAGNDASKTADLSTPEKDLSADAVIKESPSMPVQNANSGPPTVRIKPAPALKVRPDATQTGETRPDEQPPTPQAGQAAKRSTSRIPLPSGVGAPPRPVTYQQREVMPPLTDSSQGPRVPSKPSEAQVQAAKSKTSRISLDAALTGNEGGATQTRTPKTIRLKRPSETLTFRDPPRPDIEVAKPAPSDAPAGGIESGLDREVSSATSRLPELGDDASKTQRKTIKVGRQSPAQAEGAQGADDATITRRKTIKVRRPITSPTIAGEDATEEGAAPLSKAPSRASGEVDIVNPFFPICALAAALVAVTLIWVLASQIIGPDRTLSRLSIWPTGPELWMPGRAMLTE